MKKKVLSMILAIAMVISMFAGLATTASAAETATYSKLTKAPTDWSGTYILVYEDATSPVIWTGVDAANCNEAVSIINSKITVAATATLTIAPIDATAGTYSIMVNGGTND